MNLWILVIWVNHEHSKRGVYRLIKYLTLRVTKYFLVTGIDNGGVKNFCVSSGQQIGIFSNTYLKDSILNTNLYRIIQDGKILKKVI